jgi:hypothetical protein
MGACIKYSIALDHPRSRAIVVPRSEGDDLLEEFFLHWKTMGTS